MMTIDISSLTITMMPCKNQNDNDNDDFTHLSTSPFK